MKKKLFTALGLMTGTSMDGVDLSLIKTDGYTQFSSILDNFYEFDEELQKKLIDLREKILSANDLIKYSDEINKTEKEFTLFHCRIMRKVIEKYESQIDVIGFHGQTIFHDSSKNISKQIGDGKLLSQITKKIVINNFREKDLLNGGQGAPLTPIFHKLISQIINQNHNIEFPLNIINVGGITNITQIKDNNFKSDSNFFAYDIAPGNCLIDKWIRKNSKKKFDEKGKIARAGKVNDLTLNQALDNFDILKFDKSLDIKDFDISFVKGLSLEDGCSTLTKFTADLICEGIQNINKLNNSKPINNLICGGGRKNEFLIELIKQNLNKKEIKIENINQFGFDGDFVESQAFAYLSIRRILNLPISFPNTTKCKTPTVGGTINKNF